MGRREHKPNHNHSMRSIQHFSHPHPLLLIDPQNLTITTPCSGCELQPSGWMYTCTCSPCKFTLHKSCADMPHRINDPSHPSHPLTLLPTSRYPGSAFTCDSCRGLISGFCFSCNHCNFDIHIRCARPTSSMTNMPAHRPAGASDFDIHIRCARPTSSMTNMPAHRPAGANNSVRSRSIGHQISQDVRPGPANGNDDWRMARQAFVQGAAEQAGRSLIRAIVGDGSGGGDPGEDNAEDSSILDVLSSIFG